MSGSIFADAPRDAAQAVAQHLYEEARWYACYTRARAEKQVARSLSERNIDSYLPLVPQTRQWKDRKKLVSFPLFPSYVFGRFTLREVHTVLVTPGISTIVRVNGYPAPIADSELDNVRRFANALSATDIQPDPQPYFAEGEMVRVTEGPFEGVEGVVMEVRGRKRVLVGIAAIGQGLAFDIDSRFLGPVRS